MSKKRKDKIGKGVLVRGTLICIAVVAISFSLIPGLAAQGAGDSVNVTVSVPEYVAGTFNVDIDVDSVTNFNSGQFDLSFDSDVVNVTVVADGMLDSETIPVDRWEFVDSDTIRVILEVSGIAGVNGSGNLATICFDVVGMGGERSVLSIADGMLVNTEAEEIPAEWIDSQVTVGPVKVEVNAPELVEIGGSFEASIDVDSIANFNSGQFDLSFDSSIVNVTDVADGMLDGETIPVDKWEFVDEDTIRVILEVSGIAGVNGSGNLATISFEVVGMGGDRSVLDIDAGMLVNTEAEAVHAEWMDDLVIAGPVKVEVNAPETAKMGETFVASIDVANIADFTVGLFDLSFNSSVVNVTEVANGKLDGEAIPVDTWEFVDNDTIRVFLYRDVQEITSVSGTGNLATISFEVVGKSGDETALDLSNGMLANNEADEIPTEWIDGKVTIGE
nr:hypothetical secreted protein [uncultured archaeon]